MRYALLAIATAAAAATATAHAGTGAGLVRYLPDDTAEVLVLDVAHARTGPQAGRLVELLHRHSDRWKAIADSGVDLAAAIDTLVVAAAPDEDGRNHHQITIIDGKLAVLLAHLPHDPSRATHLGAITVYPIDGGEVAIVDHHLIMASAGDLAPAIARGHRTPAAAAAALARGGTIANVRTILATGAASGADVWGGSILSANDRAMSAQQLDGEPVWIGFAMAAAARASLDVHIAFVDERAAANATGALQRMFVGPEAQLRMSVQSVIGPEFADSLAIDQDRAQVHVSAGMSIDEGEQLGNLLGQAL